MKTIFKALFLFITLGMSAQQSATKSEVVTKALQEKVALTNTSIIKNISFSNIGPTIMSGRVADIDVNPNRIRSCYKSTSRKGGAYKYIYH